MSLAACKARASVKNISLYSVKRTPDISKAKDLLGWEPKVPFRKGRPFMVSDFRDSIFGDHKEDGALTTTTTTSSSSSSSSS